jgi:hypothetical protein
MEQALQAESNAAWMDRADRWLAEQPRGRLFSSDDIVAAIGRPHQIAAGKNNVIGAWTNSRARLGRMEDTGRMVRSKRVEGHGNKQALWRVQVPEDQHRVGGDAGDRDAPRVAAGAGEIDLPARAGVSSSPLRSGDESAAAVGQDAVSSSGPSLLTRSELERAAADGLADAPPGGPPDVGEQLRLEAA